MQSFSIFVINLPTAVERRQAMEAQLKAMHAQFEFVEGVFGNDERVAERYDEARAIREHGKPLVTGEKGCALAHALVYERMVQEKIPTALILEDDMVLPKDFLKVVEREVNRMGRTWDWLSFDYRYVGMRFLYHWFIATLKTIRKRPRFIFYAFLKLFYIPPLCMYEGVRNTVAWKLPPFRGPKRFHRPLYNAGAYLVTLEGARKLIPFTKPIRLAADETQNVASRQTDFRLRGYVPLIVRQDLERFGTDAGRTEEEWEAIFKSTQTAI